MSLTEMNENQIKPLFRKWLNLFLLFLSLSLLDYFSDWCSESGVLVDRFASHLHGSGNPITCGMLKTYCCLRRLPPGHSTKGIGVIDWLFVWMRRGLSLFVDRGEASGSDVGRTCTEYIKFAVPALWTYCDYMEPSTWPVDHKFNSFFTVFMNWTIWRKFAMKF